MTIDLKVEYCVGEFLVFNYTLNSGGTHKELTEVYGITFL